MNAQDILDLIGDAKGTYVWDAQEVRAGTVPVTKKRPSTKRAILIAAMIALILLLMGCTIAYVQGWFVNYFSGISEIPLSDSQISLIEQSEQKFNETQSHNGWTVELRSAVKDNSKAYIIIGITAPEGVDLEPEIFDGVMTEQFSPGNVWPVNSLENPSALVVYPSGVIPHSIQTSWQEDGDGKDNSKNYVIEIEPDDTASTSEPFAKNLEWRIHIENIVRTYDDEEYKQELLNTKYKDDYAVMFTPEEIQQMMQQEVLVEGIWDFSFTFADQSEESQELELLLAPIQTVAEIPWRHGEALWDVVVVRKSITVNSIILQPFSAKISYSPCGGHPSFCIDDGDIDRSNNIHTNCVLKDGTQIALVDYGSGGDGYKLLEANSPIVLEDVLYLQLPDGTRVYTNGETETMELENIPTAARDYRNIQSDTGTYCYCSDFDGDDIEDMAIWYDHSFRVVCLLNEKGVVKETFTFEDGIDVYHTYNQRADTIKHEPNLIRVSKAGNGVETVHYFHANEKGLFLNVGVKYDANGLESKWYLSNSNVSSPYDASQETWAPITEEAYRSIVDDYQAMEYRLIPIT